MKVCTCPTFLIFHSLTNKSNKLFQPNQIIRPIPQQQRLSLVLCAVHVAVHGIAGSPKLSCKNLKKQDMYDEMPCFVGNQSAKGNNIQPIGHFN